MDNTLIDNSSKLKLIDSIKSFISDEKCTHIQIATGYWDIPGIAAIQDELKTFLERGGRLDLLIGKEPQLRSYQLRQDIQPDEMFPDFYIARDVNLLSDLYKPAVSLLLDYIDAEDEEKSQIRIHVYGQDGLQERFLHAKCYIFYNVQDGKPVNAYGIVGSSNFTKNGLEDNAELNYLETNSLVVAASEQVGTTKSHKVWFEEMWEQSVPWSGKFIKDILKPSRIGGEVQKEQARSNEITPYEFYIKYLQTQIGDIANEKSMEILKSFLPSKFTPLDYQLHAVLQCFYIMKQHGGFILADVVGLGKTIVGLLVAKKYIAEAPSYGRSEKVLIITPPAVKDAWEKTIADFDKDTKFKIAPFISFVTTGSIGSLLESYIDGEMTSDSDPEFQYDNFGLILIDESHNFRNKESQKYQDLDNLINTISVLTGVTPYIGLLSATPQNNSPEDLKNQILLFQREPNNSTLPNVPGRMLDRFMNEKNAEFNALRKTDSSEAKAKLKKLSEEIRDIVLNELVVRRTRQDIKKHYQQDGDALKFPTIKGPHKLGYELDPILCRLFADTIELIIGDKDDPTKPHIGYYRYAAIKYFVDIRNTRLYEKRNLTVESISERMATLMKIMLVKRLESSFNAFRASLHNLQTYTQNMIDMISADTVFICPDIDINAFIAKYKSLEKATPHIMEKISLRGGNNRCFKSTDFRKDEYLSLLRNDKRIIDDLCARWDANNYDPKLEKFKESISTELFNPEINNPSGYDSPRLVIFTEAIDTAESLVRSLEDYGHRVLKVTAANRTEMRTAIVENFDANSDIKKDDYDVIVTTEVLAEGVNLHRSNVILNYDTPWNATRLMQRIGRVNRIGSKEDYVHVFNFFPSTKGNEQIKLRQIAYAKLQAFHVMFGEDNKVFSELEELSEVEFQHIVDDELSPLGEFICDLKDFQRSNPARYKQLSEMDFADLGGRVDSGDGAQSMVFIDTPKRGLTSILVSDSGKAQITAPIAAMKFLKCSKDATFSKMDDKQLSAISDIAFKTYYAHVNKMRTAKDAKKEIKSAMIFLHEEIKPQLSGADALKAYSYADNALRNGAYSVARQILRFAKEYHGNGASLFGVDYDLSSWIETTFGKLAQQVTETHGEPYVAAVETK